MLVSKCFCGNACDSYGRTSKADDAGTLRDGPLENLWGRGGGGGRITEKIFAQGKIKCKNIH